MTTIEQMTIGQLVAEYNRLNPDKPVKRFSDRATAVKRVYAALGQQPSGFTPAAPAPAAEPPKPVEASAAPQPAVTPTAPAKRASKRGGAAPKEPAAVAPAAPAARTLSHAAAPGGKLPRPESKRGQLLAALQTPKGLSVDEMMQRFEWKKNDCADALRLLAKKNGVAVACGADGRWRVAK